MERKKLIQMVIPIYLLIRLKLIYSSDEKQESKHSENVWHNLFYI